MCLVNQYFLVSCFYVKIQYTGWRADEVLQRIASRQGTEWSLRQNRRQWSMAEPASAMEIQTMQSEKNMNFNPRTPGGGGVDATPPLAFFPVTFLMIPTAEIASAYLLLGMGDTFWHMWHHLDAVTWHMSWRHMYMTVVKIHCFYHCLLIEISFDVDAIKWWGWCRFQLNWGRRIQNC